MYEILIIENESLGEKNSAYQEGMKLEEVYMVITNIFPPDNWGPLDVQMYITHSHVNAPIWHNERYNIIDTITRNKKVEHNTEKEGAFSHESFPADHDYELNKAHNYRRKNSKLKSNTFNEFGACS